MSVFVFSRSPSSLCASRCFIVLQFILHSAQLANKLTWLDWPDWLTPRRLSGSTSKNISAVSPYAKLVSYSDISPTPRFPKARNLAHIWTPVEFEPLWFRNGAIYRKSNNLMHILHRERRWSIYVLPQTFLWVFFVICTGFNKNAKFGIDFRDSEALCFRNRAT